MEVSSEVLISICCATYNHGNYIRECLDGFVMQQTTFQFEILVHEDASTDNTAEILKEYETKYPHLFRCVYQTVNQFLIQNALLNILFPMAKGKYIAMCEGDDYWTDPLKLQKQVDFLEANPDYNICYTNAYYVKEENNFKLIENDIFFEKKNPSRAIEQDELLFQNCILTLTVVFRNRRAKYPDWYQKVEFGDWCLHIINSFFGKIMYLSDVTAVYRKHANGIFSNLGNVKQLIAYINSGEVIRQNIAEPASKKMLAGQSSRLSQLLDLYIQEKAYMSFFNYSSRFHYLLTAKKKAKHIFSFCKSLIR